MSKSSVIGPMSAGASPVATRLLLLLVVTATTVLDTAARQVSARAVPTTETGAAVDTLIGGRGHAIRRHFPDMLYETQGAMDVPFSRAAEQYGDLEVLPKVDFLRLEYEWSVVGGRPRLAFDFSWVAGEGGVLDGRLVSAENMPDSVLLQSVDLSAEIRVHGHRVGNLRLSLDSLDLPQMPFSYAFETVTDGWADLFANMDSVATRRAFDEGFELTNLDVVRIGFASFDTDSVEEREVRVIHRIPTRTTVFIPDPGIWIGWTISSDSYRPPPRTVRAPNRPRGQTGRQPTASRGSPSRGSTRATAGDGKSRGSKAPWDLGGNKKDDDKDDESDLLIPAIAAAAAVVGLVFVGGTIGPAGWSDAPMGIAAGRITYRGGYLVHMAMNEAVLTGGAQERVRIGLTGVARPAIGPLQPLAGLGVRIDDESGHTTSTLSLEVGLAIGFDRVFVLGGVDVLSGAGRGGLVFALRNPGSRPRS